MGKGDSKRKEDHTDKDRNSEHKKRRKHDDDEDESLHRKHKHRKKDKVRHKERTGERRLGAVDDNPKDDVLGEKDLSEDEERVRGF